MASRTILIPLDDSKFSRQIVRIVRSFISPDDVELVLFCAVQPAGDEAVPSVDETVAAEELDGALPDRSHSRQNHKGPAVTVDQNSEQKRVEAALAVEVDRLAGSGYSARAVVQWGDPSRSIIEYANANQVDMIAMATHGTRGPGGVVHDSVAEKVVHGVTVPVLLMRNSPDEIKSWDNVEVESGSLSKR